MIWPMQDAVPTESTTIRQAQVAISEIQSAIFQNEVIISKFQDKLSAVMHAIPEVQDILRLIQSPFCSVLSPH